jgi:hypothetical protein
LGSHQLESAGLNHLDGVQAVAYARLRLMDTDYNRTARQRLVISLAMEKAKQADLKTLTTVVNAVLPQISTSIGIDDLLPLAKNVKKYHIGESGGFPFSRGEALIGKKDCVIPCTLESNVIQAHQFLYDDMDYTPSATVKEISAKIAADSGMGEVKENAPAATVGGGSSSGSSSANNSSSGESSQAQPAPVETTVESAEESTESAEEPEEDETQEEDRSSEEITDNVDEPEFDMAEETTEFGPWSSTTAETIVTERGPGVTPTKDEIGPGVNTEETKSEPVTVPQTVPHGPGADDSDTKQNGPGAD